MIGDFIGAALPWILLKGRILLILPDKDFFSEAMQNNLIALMLDPRIKYVSGGHLSTVFQAAEYMQEIRAFLLAR